MTRWREGGLMVVDHRNSPGISEEQMRALGLHHPGFAAGSFLEVPTKKCTDCQRIVLMNPKRIRERATCKTCGGYICDECAAKQYLGEPCRNPAIREKGINIDVKI